MLRLRSDSVFNGCVQTLHFNHNKSNLFNETFPHLKPHAFSADFNYISRSSVEDYGSIRSHTAIFISLNALGFSSSTYYLHLLICLYISFYGYVYLLKYFVKYNKDICLNWSLTDLGNKQQLTKQSHHELIDLVNTPSADEDHVTLSSALEQLSNWLSGMVSFSVSKIKNDL